MPSQFEALLIDVARQVGGVAKVVEENSRQMRQMASEHASDMRQVTAEIGALRDRVSKLEKTEEWDGQERRKVDRRLETGDHTFQKMQEQIKDADNKASLARREVESLAKRMSAGQRQAFGLWKAIILAVLAAALSITTTIITNAMSKPEKGETRREGPNSAR